MHTTPSTKAAEPVLTAPFAQAPVSLPSRIDALEFRMVSWWARHGIVLLRLALGIVFVWFGAQKFFPGVSVAQELATNTISRLSFGHVPPSVSLPVLATWEVAIGLGLLTGKFLRATLLLLFAQMAGTFLPLVFFPHETFKSFPLVPTLEGQYIIKNLVLVAAGLVVGATMRGGRLIHDPAAAMRAEEIQVLNTRFRRRYGRSPDRR
ncbi:DoxX family protein [Deinococcus sp.]|uniref:DoxX family protein n=1 Tax=Deinococcus sp. TaxID=47478 RepID=UPI002869B5F0|nr:DoxX family protein [Deinococcus sp.]